MDSRHSPPPRHLPTRPNHQRSTWPSTSLARLAGVTVGGNASITTAAKPVATLPLSRRSSDVPVVIPALSSPLPAGGAAAAAAASTPRYTDGGSGGGEGVVAAGGSGRGVHDYPERRRASPSQGGWSHYPGTAASLGTYTPRAAESWTGRDGGAASLLGGAETAGGSGAEMIGGMNARGDALPQWRAHSAGDQVFRRHPSMSTAPAGAEQMRDSARSGAGAGAGDLPVTWPLDEVGGYRRSTLSASGRGRYQEAGTLPQVAARLPAGRYGGEYSRPPFEDRGVAGTDARNQRWRSHTPASSAEAAAVTATLHPLPSWDLGKGGQGGGETKPRQQGGGSAQVGLGGSHWSAGAGDHGGGARSPARAYADADLQRELFYDDRRFRHSPLRDQCCPRSSQPKGYQHREQLVKLRPTFPPVGTTITPSLGRRGGSDPGLHSTASGPRFSIASVNPSAGLVRAVATVGDKASGGGGGVSFGPGEAHGDPGFFRCSGGTFGVGAGAADNEQTRQRRRWDTVTRRTWRVSFDCCLGRGLLSIDCRCSFCSHKKLQAVYVEADKRVILTSTAIPPLPHAELVAVVHHTQKVYFVRGRQLNHDPSPTLAQAKGP